MIQVYLLSVIYMLLSSLLMLLDSYRLKLSFLLPLRHLLITDKRTRAGFFAAGLVLCILQLLFPIAPGPRLLGDLAPAITVLLLAFYYLNFKGDEVKNGRIYASSRTNGLLLLAFTFIHFLFPMGVLV